MATTKQARAWAAQRRRTAFSVWVDALRLRAAMRKMELPRITDDEWQEYDKPSHPCPELLCCGLKRYQERKPR